MGGVPAELAFAEIKVNIIRPQQLSRNKEGDLATRVEMCPNLGRSMANPPPFPGATDKCIWVSSQVPSASIVGDFGE